MTDASCTPGEVCVEGACKAVCKSTMTWVDLTGYGHDGTLENFGPNPWVGDGTPGNPYALLFDGTDDAVRVAPSLDSLRFDKELSVEAWVRPEAPAVYYKSLFSARSDPSYNGYGLALSFADGHAPNPNSWAWYACTDGSCPYWSDAYSDTSASITMQWYHIVGTYSVDAGVERLYVNGVKQADEHAVAAPIRFLDAVELKVGNGLAYDTGFQGRMAIVRVWSRALAGAEVADLFARDAPRFGLQAPSPASNVSNQDLKLHYQAGPCNSSGNSVSYDPAVDFSATQNPSGPWSYGWSDSMGAPLQLYPETLSEHMLQQWGQTNATLSSPPFVIFNPNDSTLVEGSYSMPPKSLNLHPGLNGEYSVVRWTAPAAGSYHVSATFTALDGTTTDVAIQQSSSTSLFTGYVTVGSPAGFTGDITVQSGETIDFMVGFGGNGFICDSTQLEAKITSM
jgi:hypothetical protein